MGSLKACFRELGILSGLLCWFRSSRASLVWLGNTHKIRHAAMGAVSFPSTIGPMIPLNTENCPCLSLFLFITGSCACATAIQTNRVQKRRIQKAAWLHGMSVEACRSWKQCIHPRILRKSLNFQRSEVLRLYGTCFWEAIYLEQNRKGFVAENHDPFQVSWSLWLSKIPRSRPWDEDVYLPTLIPYKNQPFIYTVGKYIQSSHGWYRILWFISQTVAILQATSPRSTRPRHPQ